ncbi:hypothetical protein MC7420_6765 [Coleofasciculus chthonoplastes PCC 7420]|uniref:Uncharacterized protein n=1 Tax=Coleofasciculus chthonoplastes PCC 7420 TaxID=118168 RepID=B4VWP9_9CYAN|nr:hypothetical protein MC7420_6765 [Coleofasciculus chthonoplastes PCC 7420]
MIFPENGLCGGTGFTVIVASFQPAPTEWKNFNSQLSYLYPFL